MVIAVDVDGVLRNLMQSLCDVYNRKMSSLGDYIMTDDINEWDIAKAFPIGKAIYKFAFNDYLEEVYDEALPHGDNVKQLVKWQEDGHYIILITSQSSHRARIATLNWIERYCITFNELVFSNAKIKYPFDLLVEDKLETVRECLLAGKKCYLVDRPWNRTIGHDDVAYVRVKSLSDISL